VYLHLGQNVVVPLGSVVGVFDLDNTTGSHLTRAFLSSAEKAGHIVNISDDIPKSFVICREGDKETIYLSQLASTTLLKRSETMRFE
jgi:hypothetical protein